MLETLGEVYGNDALARDQRLTPDARLKLHQEKSGPLMEQLHQWMTDPLNGHKTEPNSGLGKSHDVPVAALAPVDLVFAAGGGPTR